MADESSATLRLAVVAAIFCSAATALYIGARTAPAPVVQWWLTAGPLMMVILWVYQDARHRRIGAVTDLGFFLMLFWPIAIPWFVFTSRGRSGWKLLLGLTALILATPVTGLAVAALRAAAEALRHL